MMRSIRSLRPYQGAFYVPDVENRNLGRVVGGQFPTFVRFFTAPVHRTASPNEVAEEINIKAAERSSTKSTDDGLNELPFEIKDGGLEEGYITLKRKYKDEIIEIKVRPYYYDVTTYYSDSETDISTDDDEDEKGDGTDDSDHEVVQQEEGDLTDISTDDDEEEEGDLTDIMKEMKTDHSDEEEEGDLTDIMKEMKTDHSDEEEKGDETDHSDEVVQQEEAGTEGNNEVEKGERYSYIVERVLKLFAEAEKDGVTSFKDKILGWKDRGELKRLYVLVKIHFGIDYKECLKFYIVVYPHNKFHIRSMSRRAAKGTEHLQDYEQLFKERVFQPSKLKLNLVENINFLFNYHDFIGSKKTN